MRTHHMAVAVVAALAWTAGLCAAEPWREFHQGEEATGDHVIALWQFQAGAETEDASGNGHALTLRGESRFSDDGLFGSCLETFHSAEDRPYGATVANRPALTPQGAFTLELWIRPRPQFTEAGSYFLLDKQYFRRAGDPGGDNDYQLTVRVLADGRCLLEAYLGYGEDSEHFRATPVTFAVDEWSHVVFTYDGRGRGRFFVNGQPAGETLHEGRGPVNPGRHPLIIGGRVGSLHSGFPGSIDQVRIINGVPSWLAPKATAAVAGGRTVFERMEPEAAVTVIVKNDLEAPLQNLRATATLDGVPLHGQFPVREIPPARQGRVEIPVDVSLKPGEYPFTVRLAGEADGQAVELDAEGAVTIVPRPTPHVMPVVMWGVPEMQYRVTDFDSLHEIGFTHTLMRGTDGANLERVWQAGRPLVPSLTPDPIIGFMDAHLAQGLKYVVTTSPAYWLMSTGADVEERKARFQRVNRFGEPYGRANVCAMFPEVQDFAYNIGASIGQTFGKHPALDGALIHTEVRDGTNLCFHEHDLAAYRAHSGRDIPEDAVQRDGVPGSRRAEFVPPNGIIADDHPLLDFFRWFWREGDGWNELHSQVHRGLKTGTHENFWTFFDPAVRVPPLWGSGGEVDVLSQWTYTYPDPPRMGLATDELFAMAEGRPGQQVMKMTQIIWYREQTAPDLPENEEDRVEWERTEPEARFITIAPDHLREALWLKLSRPIQGIMYHGSSSLGMGNPVHTHSYRYTNPETRTALAELVHNVVVPFGPTLKQIPDPPADIAMLESFTSHIFGMRGTYGWGSGWVADMHHILQWARLQPRIVYEETIVRDGLDGIRVLVMPNCAVLPHSVHERILDFQDRGGIVVADRHLAAAITPDIILRQPPSGAPPHENKAALQALAAQLREELAPLYSPRADSSDPDVIVRLRQYGDTAYLFVINDRRTYGNYVGQHGLVMEQGLPHEASVSVDMPGATVYDLLDGRAVQTEASARGPRWDVSLGPGEGRVYMLTPRPLESVRVQVGAREPGDRAVRVLVQVVDAAGRPISAVVPVQIEVLDPDGAAAEFSGYYGAADGEVSLDLTLAPNDAPGTWTVRAREMASGRTAEARFEYRP